MRVTRGRAVSRLLVLACSGCTEPEVCKTSDVGGLTIEVSVAEGVDTSTLELRLEDDVSGYSFACLGGDCLSLSEHYESGPGTSGHAYASDLTVPDDVWLVLRWQLISEEAIVGPESVTVVANPGGGDETLFALEPAYGDVFVDECLERRVAEEQLAIE